MRIRTPINCGCLSAVVLLTLTPSAFAIDFIFSAGVYVPGSTAPEPLVAGQVLQINSGSNKFFSGSTLTNQSGLVNWNADSLFMQNGALIDNSSVWDAKSDNALVNNGGPLSTFNNSGTLRKSGGLGATTIGSISFVSSGIIDAQTGSINFAGGNTTFNAGSHFTGAGSTLVSNNASFNGAFTSSNLSLTSGTFSGTSAQVNGTLSFVGGVFTGDWEVASGQSLFAKDGSNKFMSGAALTNNGTVQWQTGNTLFMQNSSSFTNNALHDILATSTIANNGGPLSTYTNSSGATLRVAAGQTATIGSIGFVNDGGKLTADGTFNFAGGNASFNNGTRFVGAGTNVVTNNASFNGAISSSNLALQNGSFSGSAAELHGVADFVGGAITGSWELASGQVLNGKDGSNKFLTGASFTNKGNVRWLTANTLFMQNGSTFDNQGSFDMLAGAVLANNGGPLSSFVNSGTLHVATGQAGNVGAISFVNSGGSVASDGTLTFSGGNARFNGGTSFTGSGASIVASDVRFVDNFSAQNLRLTNSSFNGGDGSVDSKAVASGVVEFAGGAFAGNWELAAGQSLIGVNGSNKFLNGAQFANKGTVRWQTSETLFMQNSAVLDNRGLYTMQTGAAIVNNGGPLPTFVNSGTLQVAAGQGSTIGSIAFVNNAGTLEVGAGGSLNFAGGNANFNAGTQFIGAGVNIVSNNAGFNGSFSSTNLSLRSGTFTGSGALLNGSADFSGGAMQGDWTVAAGATLNGVDGSNKFLNATTLTNQGTIAWKSGNSLFLQNGAIVANQGKIDLQADSSMLYNGGPVGSFINTGLITKTAGNGTSTIGNNLGFDNQGVVDVSTGTIRLPDNFTNNGRLKGVGAFATNVLTNAGHVAPGSSPGTLTLNGNFVQTTAGFLDTEIASSTLFDTFLINGTASLNGTLALSCVLTCDLHDNDVFVILDSTSELTGTFANITTTNFGNGFEYQVIYDYDADLVKLMVVHAGDVGPPPVPEPATWALVASGLAVMGALARRRRAQAL